MKHIIMEKGKIVLVVIIILSIASGAIAFKTNQTATIFTGTSPCLCTQAVQATISFGDPWVYASIAPNDCSKSGLNCPYTCTVFNP